MHHRTTNVLLVALIYPTLLTWVYFVVLDGRSASLQQLVYAVGKTLQFGLPAVWVWLLTKSRRRLLNVDGSSDAAPAADSPAPSAALRSDAERTLVDRPFAWDRPQLRGLAEGVAFGLAVALAMAGLYFWFLQDSPLLGDMRQKVLAKVRGFDIDSPARYLALGAFYSLAHSGLEEYYWRWFVFRGLKSPLGVGGAMACSSLGFMAHHVLLLASFLSWTSPLTWVFSLSIAVGGAVWAYQYQRSGQLYGSWLGHLCVDAAIFWIGWTLIAV